MVNLNSLQINALPIKKTAEKSALLSSLNLKFFALHSKELLGDVGAALGVLGVPVRADFFGVFRGQHGTAHHDLAVQLRRVQGGDQAAGR